MTVPAHLRPRSDEDTVTPDGLATVATSEPVSTVDPRPEDASNDSLPMEPSFRSSNLADVRNRLLDLTARNPLLHLKHTATRTMRFVDTTPDTVWRTLSDSKAIPLIPVPEPTDEQRIAAGYLEIDAKTGECVRDERPKADVWARYLDIPTEHDLKTCRGDADGVETRRMDLQTLLFRDALGGRLRKIRNLASASVEERGASILYLVLGFLEWYESPSSNKARFAPLMVEPVTLTRTSRGQSGGLEEYRLAALDEDAPGNLSLAEKLRREFGLTLPERGEEELPEAWFVRVEDTIQEIDLRWRVRRHVSLCLLDFTKQAMYLDLDPARWPDDRLLELHSHKANRPELLASLVSAAERRGSHVEPDDLDGRIRRLESMREELSRTATAMNTPWCDTGLTPHEILQRATERRDHVSEDAPQVEGIEAMTLGRTALEDTLHVAERLVQAFNELSEQADGDDVRAHLWYGVTRSEFVDDERDALFSALGTWNERLDVRRGTDSRSCR